MKNLKKAWLTTLVGIIIILFTTYSVSFTHKIQWVWEGIAGISVGSVLFFAPRTFEKAFEKLIEKFTPKP